MRLTSGQRIRRFGRHTKGEADMAQSVVLNYDDGGNQYLEVELTLMEARDIASMWPEGTAKAITIRTPGRPRGQFYHPSAVLVGLSSQLMRVRFFLPEAPANWEKEDIDQSLVTECPKCQESLDDTLKSNTGHLYERQCASCGYVVSHGVELLLESDWLSFQSNFNKWHARGSHLRHSDDNSPL